MFLFSKLSYIVGCYGLPYNARHDQVIKEINGALIYTGEKMETNLKWSNEEKCYIIDIWGRNNGKYFSYKCHLDVNNWNTKVFEYETSLIEQFIGTRPSMITIKMFFKCVKHSFWPDCIRVPFDFKRRRFYYYSLDPNVIGISASKLSED